MSVDQNAESRPAEAGRVTAGIDWASADHAVAIVDGAGVARDRFVVAHRAADLRRLVTRLHRAGVGEVAIERGDGPVVDALIEGGLTVFVIAPNQLKNLRSRYGQAGNKDDRFDAFVLADTLRTDRARLRPLTRDCEQTLTLRMTVRARQDLVRTRVGLGNQLRAHLETTLPGAIGLFRDIDSDITLAFLRRFPGPAGEVAAQRQLQPPGQPRAALGPPARRGPRHHRSARPSPGPDHPGPGCRAYCAAAADRRAGRPDRRAARRPPGRRGLHLAAPFRHRPRRPAARRDR
jgi:hypothetical protein